MPTRETEASNDCAGEGKQQFIRPSVEVVVRQSQSGNDLCERYIVRIRYQVAASECVEVTVCCIEKSSA